MEQSHIPMLQVKDVFVDMHNSMIATDNYKTYAVEIRQHIGKVCRTHHLYAITDTADLVKLWDAIRANVPVTEYLLDTTAHFHLLLAGSGIDFNNLVGLIAKALGANRGLSADNRQSDSVIDNALLAQLPESIALERMIQNNPWFVTLYLYGCYAEVANA